MKKSLNSHFLTYNIDRIYWHFVTKTEKRC